MKFPFKMQQAINWTAKHAPDILTIANGVGVVATGIVSGKAGAKIHEELKAKQEELGRKLTVKEQIACSWRHYILPTVTGGLTIASGVASNRLQAKQLAEVGLLAAAYSDKVQALEKKIEEKFGKEEVKNAYKEADEQRSHIYNEFALDGEIKVWEPVSKQSIRTTNTEIIAAELTANKMFANTNKLGFNQFLALFKHAKPMKDDSYGWFVGDEYSDYNWSYYKGVPWIDIQPQIVSTPEGETILQMAYGMWPYPEYLTTDDNPDIHLSEYYINKRSDAK